MVRAISRGCDRLYLKTGGYAGDGRASLAAPFAMNGNDTWGICLGCSRGSLYGQ